MAAVDGSAKLQLVLNILYKIFIWKKIQRVVVQRR